jgi:hypothetical protein
METNVEPQEPMDIANVHRSPHTYEIVDPKNESVTVDRRSLPENIAARVRGHRHSTNCGSEQLYVNNQLSTDPVAVAAELDPDRLHNARPPNFAIIHEKPWHRMLVYLKAQGLSDKELAARSGHTQSWISSLCRQPWFRLRLVQELKDAGQDNIRKVLQASALDSVFTLIDIRDDSQAPKAVRRACADSLLDRYLGRPTQHITDDTTRIPSSPELVAIEQELSEINQQLGDTNGATTSTGKSEAVSQESTHAQEPAGTGQ